MNVTNEKEVTKNRQGETKDEAMFTKKELFMMVGAGAVLGALGHRYFMGKRFTTEDMLKALEFTWSASQTAATNQCKSTMNVVEVFGSLNDTPTHAKSILNAENELILNNSVELWHKELKSEIGLTNSDIDCLMGTATKVRV